MTRRWFPAYHYVMGQTIDQSENAAPSPADLARYDRDGYLLVKGLFTGEEMAVARTEGHAIISRLAGRYDVNGRWTTADGAEAGDPVTSLSHCHDLQLHAATFGRLLFDSRLAAFFAALMSTEDVQLHHNKMFIKPPEAGSPFPLHQDWPFFPHRDDSLMAAIVHLDDAPEERGCLAAVPGSHRSGRRQHTGEPHWFIDDQDLTESAESIPAEAGDVLFFSCLTVHGSGVNRSQEPRTTWLVQVRDAADRPTVDRHRSPGQGTMLSGVNAADPPPPSSFR